MRKEKSLYAIPGHIRKSTISELYEFFGVCPHLLSLATVALWIALSYSSVGTHFCVLDVNFR